MEKDFGQASVKCKSEIGDPLEKQLIGSVAEGRQYSPSVDMKLWIFEHIFSGTNHWSQSKYRYI
jgi:hypothetical protein